MRTAHREATVYDTTTRSTLEARWAIFFRELGLNWRYEPERIDGYLPDFHVEGFGYVEIKPTLALFIEESSERIGKVARANPSIKIYAFCGNGVSFNTVALYASDQILAPTARHIYMLLVKARFEVRSVGPLSPEAQDAFITRVMHIANTARLHGEWKTMKDVLPEVISKILQRET